MLGRTCRSVWRRPAGRGTRRADGIRSFRAIVSGRQPGSRSMNFDLTPEQQQIQAAAREFAEREVDPVAREADERGAFPHHLVARMGTLGFLGGPLAREYGG